MVNFIQFTSLYTSNLFSSKTVLETEYVWFTQQMKCISPTFHCPKVKLYALLEKCNPLVKIC